MAEDYLAGASLDPPSSTAADMVREDEGGKHDDAAAMSRSSMDQRLQDSSQHESSHQPQHMYAAPLNDAHADHVNDRTASSSAGAVAAFPNDDKSRASMFFSDASASELDDSTDNDTHTTLRGMDVTLPIGSPPRPRYALQNSGNSYSANGLSDMMLSPSALDSPGNTSLSSSNLSPHQQRYRPAARSRGSWQSSRTTAATSNGGGESELQSSSEQAVIIGDSGDSTGIIGPEMMVPTLGVPVVHRKSGLGKMMPIEEIESNATGSKNNITSSASGREGKASIRRRRSSEANSPSGSRKLDNGVGDTNNSTKKGTKTKPATIYSSSSAAATSSSSDPERNDKQNKNNQPPMSDSSGSGPKVSKGIHLPNYAQLSASLASHRRKRSWSSGGNAAPAHRRTRSGDSKAAGLLTGGDDWKGMELDQLPLPDPVPLDRNSKLQQHSSSTGPSVAAGPVGRGKVSSEGRGGGSRSRTGTGSGSGNGDAGGNVFANDPHKQKMVEDARRAIEARYGSAMIKSASRTSTSMGYSETDESQRDGRSHLVAEGDDRTRRKASNGHGLPGGRPAPGPPSQARRSGSGSSLTQKRSFSPNAELSEGTHESSHSLFSWISGRFSVKSSKSRKTGLARFRPASRQSSPGRSGGRDSTISGITFSSGTTGDDSSFVNKTQATMNTRNNRLVGDPNKFGENTPLLEQEDSAINQSSSSSSSDAVISNDGDTSSTDPEADLFRQRRVMMQIESDDRESPNQGVPLAGGATPFMRSKSSLSRPSFAVPDHDADKYPTFICPNCNTRQRNFFTVSSAPRQFESPAGYLAFYMAIYVVASLFIFGLEEGWPALDCVYFAVITLTTAGLGDYVPSTDGAKIICSIFIYFGVACIGLLLGSLLASGLDDASRKRAKETMVDNCSNCARIETQRRIQSAATSFVSQADFAGVQSGVKKAWVTKSGIDQYGGIRAGGVSTARFDPTASTAAVAPDATQLYASAPPLQRSPTSPSEATHRSGLPFARSPGSDPNLHSQRPADQQQQQQIYAHETTPLGDYDQGWNQQNFPSPIDYSNTHPLYSPNEASQISAAFHSGQYGTNPTISPLPSNVMPRQLHTRHISFDLQNMMASAPGYPTLQINAGNRARNFSADLQATPGTRALNQTLNTAMPTPDTQFAQQVHVNGDDDYSNSYSTTSSSGSSTHSSYSSSSESEYDPTVPLSKVQSAKYVFLTLRQALANSVFIIAIGSFGFYFIERMSAVNAFYFTTVLLTTVGYGDIVPQTSEGKMFATVYVLIAGTVLLHNMSTISMIPIELRKRRVERAVLQQFGDQLDDAALRELATGPLVRRLQLSANRVDGLDECTREMFALAMLVRLGRISEDDVRSTFAAFRRLDVDDDGKLNSRDVIMGEIQRRQTILRQSRSQNDLRSAAGASGIPNAMDESPALSTGMGIELLQSPMDRV